MMRLQINAVILISLSLALPLTSAYAQCCDKMNGIRYCDSSAGRYVCGTGDYSSCYCTRHAIMDLQKFSGCCLWQGGVQKITEKGQVLCNSGETSEICAMQIPKEGFTPY